MSQRNTTKHLVPELGDIGDQFAHDHAGKGGAQITASAISIVDAGGYYSGTSVESALQTAGAGRTTLETNANNILNLGAASSSLLQMTIATLPGGATLTYNVTSGNEDIINVISSSEIGKIVLHNTTRGTEALISSVDTATNTITLTANVPAGWATTDVITPESQTNTSTIAGGAGKFMDIELQSSGALNQPNIKMELYWIDSGAVGQQLSIHPYETNSNPKRKTKYTNSTTYFVGNVEIPFISNRFCVAFKASGTGTAGLIVRLNGEIS